MENLGIDLKYLIAQIVNFGILFFLLKKFLYKPILKVLDERTKRIKKGLEFAKEMEKKLKEAEAVEAEKLIQAHRQAREIIERSEGVGKKVAAEILASAKKRADAVVEKALAQIENERRKSLTELKKQTAKLAVEVSTRIMGKVLDKKAQEDLLDQALSELEVK